MEELKKLKRRAILETMCKYFIIWTPAVCVCILVNDSIINNIGIGLLIAYILWRAEGMLFSHRHKWRFFHAYKCFSINSVKNTLKGYDNIKIEVDKGLHKKAITDSGFFTVNHYFSDCFISGTYRGVPFVQAEVRNVDVHRTGHNRAIYEQEYDGTFIIFPMEFPFTHIVIGNKNVGNVSVVGDSVLTGEKRFDKIFYMYLKEINEKQFINDKFVKEIVAIQYKVHGRIALSIRDGNVYIYVSSRNSPLRTNVLGKIKIDSEKVYEYMRMPQYLIDSFLEILESKM